MDNDKPPTQGRRLVQSFRGRERKDALAAQDALAAVIRDNRMAQRYGVRLEKAEIAEPVGQRRVTSHGWHLILVDRKPGEPPIEALELLVNRKGWS